MIREQLNHADVGFLHCRSDDDHVAEAADLEPVVLRVVEAGKCDSHIRLAEHMPEERGSSRGGGSGLCVLRGLSLHAQLLSLELIDCLRDQLLVVHTFLLRHLQREFEKTLELE